MKYKVNAVYRTPRSEATSMMRYTSMQIVRKHKSMPLQIASQFSVIRHTPVWKAVRNIKFMHHINLELLRNSAVMRYTSYI